MTKFGGMTGTVMLGAGAAIAGLAAVSIKAASDLGESLNKANVIFGDASDEVISFSEHTAESMGIAQSAALEAAGGFGAMFDSAGLAEKAAADMSIEMVTLAADMASFNNQDPSEMLERLRGGLAGEAEPLRRFGVFISEARVETEAYASGIAKAGEELTDAQKIQARFNIVMQDTAKQQGDFARTVGESLPNQLRTLKAQLIDVAAGVGQELLPAFLSLAETLVDLLPVIQAILQPLAEIIRLGADAISVLAKIATLQFGELDIGFTETANQFRTLVGQFQSGKLTVDEFVNSVRALETQTGIYLDVSEELQLQLDQRRDAEERGQQASLEWTTIMDNQAKAADDLKNSLEDAGEGGRIFAKELRDSLVGELPAIVGTVVKYKEAFSLSPGEMRRIADTWAEIGRTMAHDLREILQSDLSPTMKAGIAALPPEMRHAWVEGNRAQKNAIEASLRDTYRIEGIIAGLVNDARRGGSQVGAALADGIRLGITTRSETISIEAANMVHDAIEAARNAARARSPSLEMMELGKDMAIGLIEGFIRQQEKVAEKWSGMLENLLGIARSFRDSIRSGFASLLDISGAFGTEEAPVTPESIAAFFSQQQATAEQFAHVLSALRRQGASRRLLSEVGAAGPEAIPFAQALLQGGPNLIRDVSNSLQQIAHVAGDVSEQLTKSFFGQKIDAVRDQLAQENNKLQTANELLRRIEAQDRKNVTINISGVIGNETAVIQHIREALNRDGARNGGRTLTRTT